MKFQFKIQPFQTEAANSVTRVFEGQPADGAFRYRRDIGSEKRLSEQEKAQRRGHMPLAYSTLTDEQKRLTEEEYEAAWRNADIALNAQELLHNIRQVQTDNNIKLSSELAPGLGAVSLDVEMETGTGKTYCYIKTMFELYASFGWGKFIVVVPSIAIREGVKKSFEITQDHFMQLYGIKARFFVYNSSNLHQLDEFSQNSGINVMIINTQAFNTTLNEEKSTEGRSGNEAARIIYSKRDDFGSRRPIDVIKANRPIIILDEPQKMGGTATQNALKKNFNPLFSLNYSATHKTSHNLVYVLDALDAFRKKLVKKIEVKGFELKNLGGTNRYLYLAGIVTSSNQPPRARLELEVKRGAGIKRETHLLNTGDSLYIASHELEEYRGISIAEIDPIHAQVMFSNGEALLTGEAAGNVNEEDIRRIQIRETIQSHFEKEEKLFEQGIKCLSLFFIDEVAKYRRYSEDGEEIPGEYGRIFEQEYIAALNERLTLLPTDYQAYLRGIDVEETHKGYFSIDKKGRAVDSAVKRGSEFSDDITAYDLILKNKERLLSFDEPTRFIFSHSALREGWDNPNVFQICTLKHSDNATAKRQEVGRGLRLCVDKSGERQDAETLGDTLVHGVNTLTVVASESYAGFVADLQREIQSDLYDRPTKASAAYFAGKAILFGESGDKHTLTDVEATGVYNYLVRNSYVDDTGSITDDYREAAKAGSLATMKPELALFAPGIHQLVQAIFDPTVLQDLVDNGHATKVKENPLNENWTAFSELWSRINKRYAYTVDFNSNELITNAVTAINAELRVARLSYTVTKGEQTGVEFITEKTQTKQLDRPQGSLARYDLIGKVAEGSSLTRASTADILGGIDKDKLKLFQANPEEFISKICAIINSQKAAVVVEHIIYQPSAQEPYTQDIFNMSRASDEYARAFRAKHAIQDYVFTDGIADKSKERRFAEDLDAADEVIVYAKLPKGPRGFYIPTPVGNYSPDWAISFKKGTVKHIFFIAETKGSMDTNEMRPIESTKIACAKKLFNEMSTTGVKYHEADSYQSLLQVMESL